MEAKGVALTKIAFSIPKCVAVVGQTSATLKCAVLYLNFRDKSIICTKFIHPYISVHLTLCVYKLPSCRTIKLLNTWWTWLILLIKNLCASKALLWSVFNSASWNYKTLKSVGISQNCVGKIMWWSSVDFNLERVAVVSLHWTECFKELSLKFIKSVIKFFHHLYKTSPWTHGHINRGTKKQATLNIRKKMHLINTVECVPNISHTKVTDKMPGWSDTGENAPTYTKSEYISSKKIIKK